MKDILVHILVGLVMLGGAWLVGQILTPFMGNMSYLGTMIIFMVVGYYLDGFLRGSGQSKTVGTPTNPHASTYDLQQGRPVSQPTQAPIQVISQTQTKVGHAPEEVRETVRSVIAQYNAGQIDKGRYQQLLAGLVFADADGCWWTVDDTTGQWIQHKNGAWVEADPPQWLEAAVTFCINCGTQLRTNLKFCNKCGSAQS